MAVNLSPFGGVGVQFFDNSGNPLTGGKIFTYTAGTTTPQTTYTTSAGSTAHSNPIILDAGGRVPSGGEIWLTDGLQYKFLLKDANDVQIASYDNVIGINSNFVAFTNQQEIITATAGQTVFNLSISYQPGTNSLSVFVDGVNQYGPSAQYAYVETDSDTVTFINGLHVGAEVKFTTSQLNSSGSTTAGLVSFTGFQGQSGNVQNLADDDGSDWIGFEPDGANTVARSAQDKMRDVINVKDFGAVGDGITDDSAAIQAAIDYCASANPVGAAPTLGYARATLNFAPGVYLCKTTLTFYNFINYIGMRATTASTSSNTSNQTDSRGVIIRADIAIYNDDNNTQGTLIYAPAGDMYIKDISFVGTASINGNPSIGIQWGSSGGVANTGKPFEMDGTGQNCSGIKMDGCTFYTFTKAWECNTLNEAYFYNVRFESNTVDVSYETNPYLPLFGQSSEFYGCIFYGHYLGMVFGAAPSYDIKMFGGYFQGKQNNSRNIQHTNTSGSNLNWLFSGVGFGNDYTSAYSLYLSSLYDAKTIKFNFADCEFGNGAITLSKGAGTAGINNWSFSNCKFSNVSFSTNIANKAIIQGSFFENSSLSLSFTNTIKIANSTFSNLSGTAIDFVTSNCGYSHVVNNSFDNVTTPISVFDNTTNNSILMSNNIGVTASPSKGVIIDSINGITFANLGTPADGSMIYCPDGTIANPVAGSGTGCIAKRLNGVWVGN